MRQGDKNPSMAYIEHALPPQSPQEIAYYSQAEMAIQGKPDSMDNVTDKNMLYFGLY